MPETIPDDKPEKLVIDVFCAQCQKKTPHTATVGRSKELELHCGCGRFLKTPLLDAEELRAHLAEHEKNNQGRKPLTAAEIAAADAEEKRAKNYLSGLKKSGAVKVVTN